MNRWLKLITILLIFLTAGCSAKEISVKPTQIYCPAPSRPVIEKTDKVTVPVLLSELLVIVEYSRALELQIKCYESVTGSQGSTTME